MLATAMVKPNVSTAQVHRTLNISKGVIRRSELQNCDKEEMLAELKAQQVKDIQNISVKNDSGGRRNTNTYIITFSTPTIPKHLKIGFIRVPIAVFIPNPLRCFKFQKFGHGSKTCKGSITCSTCGQVGHSADSCQAKKFEPIPYTSLEHSLPCTQLAEYILEVQRDTATAPVFRLSDLVKKYQKRLEQMGIS